MSLGMALLLSGTTIATVVAGGAYCYLRMKSEFTHATIVGKEARILQWQGARGRVLIGGKEWKAYCADPVALHPGAKVLISKIEEDVLKIQPVEADVEAVDLV